jgi:hypothetical protein
MKPLADAFFAKGDGGPEVFIKKVAELMGQYPMCRSQSATEVAFRQGLPLSLGSFGLQREFKKGSD